jgi:hypothetical protein
VGINYADEIKLLNNGTSINFYAKETETRYESAYVYIYISSDSFSLYIYIYVPLLGSLCVT